MIEIVSATRLSKKEFWNTSALGNSLRRLMHDRRLVWRITLENSLSLPKIYNERIVSNDDSDILVFMHDDVWIDDPLFADQIISGLQKFDVIGVAGNKRRVPLQCSWAFVDTNFTWDIKSNLSGSIGHGKQEQGRVAHFGESPAECELLDGVFLAVKKSALKEKEVLFDSSFDFHMYDLDFCRTARSSGLSLGTWPIRLTHQSKGLGSYGSSAWKKQYRTYIEKWKD